MSDNPTPEQQLGERYAAIFHELLDLGMRQGLNAVHDRVQQLDETDREWLLMTALGFMVDSMRRTTTAGSN